MNKMRLAIGLLLFTLLATACGASARDEQYALEYDGGAEFTREESLAAAEGAAFDTAEPLSNDSLTEQTTLPDLPQERLIIRTGDLSLVVKDTEQTIADVERMVNAAGGWVVASDIYQYDDTAFSGSITVRIPADGYGSMMEAIKELSLEVQRESSDSQDVTEEYVDLSSRLGNLEATAARVRNFLDEAKNVEEALAVNQELSRLEEQIELIKGRMQYLSQSAAFSTISISLTPDVAAQPIEVGGWRPQGIAKEAVETLIETLQGVGSVLIWLALYLLPVGLVIGAPLWLAARFVWRWRRRKEGRQATAVSPPPTE